MQNFEKLGAFYLGKIWDPQTRAIRDEPLLYDARDLTTHAVCVGMTGSGKTGLCLALLEEAAIDGVPAIAIDPKGDLGNLLLTFPELRPEDFRPWIDEDEAARAGRGLDEHAAAVAERWKGGLAEWGQDGARIARLRNTADLAIYTPGSTAGRPLRLLRSFAAPAPELRGDADAMRDRIEASVSGLLTLVGLEADPVRSREHILLATLLQRAWEAGRDLDLAALVGEVQKPPVDRVGVLELEAFYPAKERFELAMTLNNLLASPGFAAWMEGEPLSVQRLLFTPEGKPRISVLSIAHLSDAERMFFVTTLLGEVVAWTRGQSGTSSLRAVVYMDEVSGYFPPVSNPPSKAPMLTLLKQARAFGVGVVLATQNPVDLDYKGLSNTGTWLLGRLQTERDKSRVLEGLEGASGGAFDRAGLEATLAGLGNRVFLLHNVHEDAPVLFQTRWAMSYLRGPLTRTQIQTLCSAARSPSPATVAAPASAPARPVLPPGIAQLVAALRHPLAAGERLVYRPALVGSARLHYVDARRGLDHWEQVEVLAPLDPSLGGDPWDGGDASGGAPLELTASAEPGAEFASLPAEAAGAKSYEGWSRTLAAWLYRERALVLHRSEALGEDSRPGETEGDFRARLAQIARERRDAARGKLEARYAPKLGALRERIQRAEERVAREQAQYGQQKLQTAISVGATVLGALFGRKLGSVGNVGRATTAARGATRAARERDDVQRASAGFEAERAKLAELERAFESELATVAATADPAALVLASRRVASRKADTAVERVALVWLPFKIGPGGGATPAFS